MDAKDVRNQLSNVLNSPAFQRSNILSRFLDFIVSETLQGKEMTLKEYVIGVSVLNKGSDFNPQLNGIVRIHASRLRKALDAYYRNEGVGDPVIISIPKGRYVPIFQRNSSSVTDKFHKHELESHPVESKPAVAVLPFESYQSSNRLDVVCSVLCHDLTAELSKFPEIGVITNYSMQCALDETSDIEQVVKELGVDYLITGYCVLEQDRIRVRTELNDCQERKLLWTESYYLDDLETDWVKGYKRVIQKVTAMTCGFFGLIYRNTLNAHVPVNYDYLYAIYWHNRYHRHFTEAAFRETLKALEAGLNVSPQSSLLLSLKAELYLNLMVMITEGREKFLQLGTDLVKKAIALDSTCQHAYQVYTWSNLLNKDAVETYRSIEKCLSVNPNNPMYIGQMGFGYICTGDYEKGLELMSESIGLNPYYTWNLNLGFSFYFLKSGDYEEALLWAEKVNRRKFLWDPLMRSSLLGLTGKKIEASAALLEVLAICPDFKVKSRPIVDTFLFDGNLRRQILKGLKMAGL